MTGQHRDETWEPGDKYLLGPVGDAIAVIFAGFTFVSAFLLVVFNVARSLHWTLALLVAALGIFWVWLSWSDHQERTQGVPGAEELL